MNLMTAIQVVVFVMGTIFIAFVSRRSLLSLEYHGFYRFFVFEFTLVLILINFPHWFSEPFSIHQIISWIFLFYSLLLIIQSVYFIRNFGGSKMNRDNSANLEFENTTNLIREGIYRYIRHPMYGSLLFLAIGTMLKRVSVITASLSIAVLIFVILTAKKEEKENIQFFGPDYEAYIKKTKMFVPLIF